MAHLLKNLELGKREKEPDLSCIEMKIREDFWNLNKTQKINRLTLISIQIIDNEDINFLKRDRVNITY